MNHNFANWELTQLLPEENPYKLIDDVQIPDEIDARAAWCSIEEESWENKDLTIQLSLSYCETDVFNCLRDAWAYEDIRLYLESKGYIITVYPYVDDVTVDEPQYQILYTYEVLKDYETDIDFTYYNTYEEARNEAIMYCLNLINTNNGHTNNRENK